MFLLVILFKPQLYITLNVASYLVFHNIAEFFSVMVSLSIFGVGWFTYDQSRNRHTLFLSCAFLAIGLMDFLHTLSYTGMPAFITPNSPLKSTQFWIAVRMYSALAFLASGYVHPESSGRLLSKGFLLASAIAVSGVVFVGVVYFPSHLPVTIIEGQGVTPFKMYSEYFIMFLFALAIPAYWKRYVNTGSEPFMYYMAAFIICIFSEFVFSGYKSVFDTYNVLGHVYKIIAFSLIYWGIFIAAVKFPYFEMVSKSDELKAESDERKRAEEKIERQNQRLKALREIDTAILSSDSVESIIGAALSHIRELIDCHRAGMALIDWEANEAVIFNVRTAGETSVTKGSRVPLMLLQAMPQAMSKPLANNQPVLIHDLTELPDLPPLLQTLSKEGLRSVCILPLFSQGSQMGTFNLLSEIPGFFDEEKIGLGREVANQVAIALTQNHLVEALRKLNSELEGRVAERTAQLEAANKELEAFAYSVSHDLRAPLRAITGYTNILLEDYEPSFDAEGKRVCGVISSESQRMGVLIDDLLAFSRLSRTEMHNSKIDMQKMAQTVFNEITTPESRERIDLQVGALPSIVGDASLIRQVWINLLANALKFTSKKERVVIEVESTQDGDEVIYSVRDNGAGFDMQYADKLFGVFQRLHSEREFEGTGVGLAIVHRVILRHGGRVWADGQVDNGAVFHFALPKKEEPYE